MDKQLIGRLIPAGLLLSSIIAVIAGLFVIVESRLITLLWTTLPAQLPRTWSYYLILCALGGGALSLIKRAWGPLPTTAQQMLREFRQRQTVTYHTTIKSLCVALVILIFGAGVGPGTALIGAVIGLSVWQTDRLRYFYFHHAELQAVPLYHRLGWLLAPTGHLQRYSAEHGGGTRSLKTKKKLIALFIVNGVIAFYLLLKAIGQPAMITQLGRSHWQWPQLWLIIPVLLVSAPLSWLYRQSSRQLQQLLSRIPAAPYQPLLGAGVIFLFAVLVPRLLFSGQLFMGLVPQVAGHQSAVILISTAFLKLLFLQLCLGTGWIGGDFFPTLFASILFGFGIAQLLPMIDTLLVVAVVTTSLVTSIFKKVWGTGLLTALFFPINLLPVIIMVLGLQWGGQALLHK